MPSVDGEEHEGGEKEEMNKGISRKTDERAREQVIKVMLVGEKMIFFLFYKGDSYKHTA